MLKASTLLVALAALFWGLSGGIGGILLADGWSAIVVAFYRGAIGLLFAIIWLGFKSNGTHLVSWRLWLWSILAGLGVAGNFIFYFISIQHGGVAVASTLMYCAPVFVYIISFAFGLEQSSPAKWLAITLVTVGVFLLTNVYQTSIKAVSLLGVGAGLMSALSYTLFIFGFKYASPNGSSQMILVIALTTLVLLTMGMSELEAISGVLNHPSAFSLFILLGVLGAGLSFVFYLKGLKYSAPTDVAIVAMIEPVTASLFAVAILNERLELLQIVGMLIILVTVTVMSVNSKGRVS